MSVTRSGRVACGALAVWSLGFGLTITSLRFAILVRISAVELSAADVGAIILGTLGQIACGILIGAGLLLSDRWIWRAVAWFFASLAVAANAAAFHYEAVFARLPSSSTLGYLAELGPLAPSLAPHAVGLAVETAATVALLVALRRLASGRLSRMAPRAVAVGAVALSLAGLLLQIVPPEPEGRWRRGLRLPVVWLAQSAGGGTRYDVKQLALAGADVMRLQHHLGQRPPRGGDDPRYPLCAPAPAAAARPNGRSLIILLLESVGREELAAQLDGAPLMPNLQRIAGDGLSFARFVAPGTHSAEGLVGLFSGVPVQTAATVLRRVPLPALPAFPLRLGQHGYRSAYLHGSDLGFEQQRSYLRMVGFDAIIEPDPSAAEPRVGWGWPDDEAFARLREWIDLSHEGHPDAPLLAVLATLSTHDPFALPSDWERRRPGEDERARFEESLIFLDHHLGRYYDHYLASEAKRGTLLVILGDHAPQQFGGERLDVPLIIVGLSAAERAAAAGAVDRVGSPMDLPATLGALVGVPPGRCDQGLDLLSPPARWPRDRIVYAVSGEQRETIDLWSDRGHARWQRRGRRLELLTDPRGEAARYRADLGELLAVLLPLNYYLITEDAYAPPPPTLTVPAAPLPRVTEPLFIAHRGSVAGPRPAGEESQLADLARVAAAGFDGIEVDLQITRDGLPVLLHDAELPDGSGSDRAVASLTLAELRRLPGRQGLATLDELLAAPTDLHLFLEAKAQDHLSKILKLGHAVAGRVRAHPSRERIQVDSFQLDLAGAIAAHCECAVGLDAPRDGPLPRRWLEAARLAGMGWVYLDHAQISAAEVGEAHRLGLRVAVYPVETLPQLTRLSPELPDAVITAHGELIAAFRQWRPSGDPP